MKNSPFVSMFTLAAWFVPALCFASSYGPALIEQPVNFGPKSDPSRIPLGDVAVICNYDYGLHGHIGSSRPCPGGAMRWESGTELDQNLASVFGISVEPQDSTQIREFPVTVRMNSWKPPSYSPYTKEQVLAATLWCLIRRAGGTLEKPLDIRVVADAHDDKPLEAKYSGKFITHSDKEDAPVPPVKVPGTVIEEDSRGVAWVVFPEETRKAPAPIPPPVITIIATGGESDTGWYLLPEWRTGSEDNSDNSNSETFSYPNMDQDALAAEILALLITKQPTEAQPLKVTIYLEEYGLAKFPAFRSAPSWKETRLDAHRITLECEFAWDAATHKVTKGSVPLVELDAKNSFISPLQETTPADSDAKNLSIIVRNRIQNGLHDGTLLAEKNMASDMLSEFGLKRQIGLAGYYEALATFYKEDKEVSDQPVKDTTQLANDEFDQLRHMGWTIGLNRGQAILIEARKEIEAAKQKKNE